MAIYRYNRSDFAPLPLTLEHMDIFLNFVDGKVDGVNTLRIRAGQPLERIELDARDLDIHSVEWLTTPISADRMHPDSRRPSRSLMWKHDPGRHKLIVDLPRRVDTGSVFMVRTRTTCIPSDHILEGLYRDTTPPGAPPQFVSQCQQWGFQRILPVFDDCTAKCTMVTTIEADARYTHMISNGNICPSRNPAGRPAPKPGDPSRSVITYENAIPMAPYLFVVCVGTWEFLRDEVVYPSGKRVVLEYLVPPGRTRGAEAPMRILKDSVLWQGQSQDYEYRYDVYRTICMEKSNFGGMENVGNTTILTSAALIDEFTSDRRLEYAYGVIVHEFEHNQCGSDVTMETPFDMWLNEAFTVDVERQYVGSRLDADVVRLDQVDAMRAPIGGPLAIEDAGHMGRIVRDGFNDPDELVDGVTYVKAAEVIRMLRLVLGPETFRRGKDLYFRRHSGGNAHTDGFFACFEEASGRDLSPFKREWLYTIGYPRVTATHHYDAKTRALHVSFEQSRTGRGGPFHVPIEFAAVDASGRDIPAAVQTVELTGPRLDVEIDNVPPPAFLSLNRNCSFYGTFEDRSADKAQMLAQIRTDPNAFNRVEAMRRLTESERARLIEDPEAEPSREWLDTFVSIARDATLRPGLKSCLLRIDEQSLDRGLLPLYRERYRARLGLLRSVARHAMPDLLDAFHAVDTYAHAAEPRDGLDARRLKGTLLRTLTAADTPETHRLAEDHYRRAWNMTDQTAALLCLYISDHPGRFDIMEEARRRWQEPEAAYTNYLTLIGAGTHDDVFEWLAAEEKRDAFRVEHPGHSRALYLSMTMNNGQLWTDRGIRWVADTVIRLAPINENTANRLVACFQLVDKLADDLRGKVSGALRRMADGVDAHAAPSTAGRIQTYLEGLSHQET